MLYLQNVNHANEKQEVFASMVLGRDSSPHVVDPTGQVQLLILVEGREERGVLGGGTTALRMVVVVVAG